jgi:hypothetical protein
MILGIRLPPDGGSFMPATTMLRLCALSLRLPEQID